LRQCLSVAFFPSTLFCGKFNPFHQVLIGINLFRKQHKNRHPIVLVNGGKSSVENERGKQELLEFAQTTLRGLIKAEEIQLGCATGLRLFCRMDIGVIKLHDGRFEYWVNEVDRTPNASLFACGVHPWGETLAKDFGDVILKLYGRGRE
jgi:hypothetical protein